jgi:uncharacterized protein YjbI with pentapeptide repeats
MTIYRLPVGRCLAHADLSGDRLADRLSNANFAGASFENANLSGARLCGLDLRKSHLAGAQLTGACYDKKTTFPENFDPAAAGAKPCQ